MSRAEIQSLTVKNYRLTDLIGDFAGEELVLVEGDSLIFRVLGNDCHFFGKNGVQILHGIYRIEKELAKFKQARLNYCIVFFKKWEALYTRYDPLLRESLILFRRILIRHLRKHVSVYSFKNVSDSQWSLFISKHRPYGFVALDTPHSSTENGLKLSEEQVLVFKSFVYSALADGIPVALLGSYKFVDNKILVSIKSAFSQRSPEHVESAYKVLSKALNKFEKVDYEMELPDIDVDSCETNAERVIVLVAGYLLRHSKSKNIMNYARLLVLLTSVLDQLSLKSRFQPSYEAFQHEDVQTFLVEFLKCSSTVLQFIDSKVNGFHDLFDSRVFMRLMADAARGKLELPEINQERALSLWKVIIDFCPEAGELLDFKPFEGISEDLFTPMLPKVTDVDTALCVIYDPVIAQFYESSEWHEIPEKEPRPLETVLDFSRLRINDKAMTNKRYEDLKSMQKKTGDEVKDRRQQSRARKQDQFFISHVQKYASSLTGAKGGQLKRLTIFTNTAKENVAKSKEAELAEKEKEKEKEEPAKKGKKDKKEKGAKKGKNGKAAKPSKADLIRAEIAAKKAEKEDNKNEMIWQETKADLNRVKDLHLRVSRLAQLLSIKSFDPYIENEMRLYKIRILLSLWAAVCVSDEEKEKNINFAVEIFREISLIYPNPITKQIKAALDDTLTAFGLESVIRKVKKLESRPLSFPFVLPELEDEEMDMEIPYTSSTFQLLHFGEYMERSMGSAPDSRVAFDPDKWQRDTLDILDRDESVFVVAPTSAGKTFISFYAMEKVLRDNDEGVVIYVAPTKALVNQLSAEVYARFNKRYPHAGQTVWSVYTRDYRINNPTNCQVLITVPHVLQSMLLQPALANAWCPKIRRIIFDEIHSIGQMEDGLVAEQLLLLSPCPIVALSATVGNPKEFHHWLSALQRARGIPVHLIEHKHRYSDLRKFVYGATRDFDGLQDEKDCGEIQFLHPASAMSFSDGSTTGLTFEPRDCLQLYHAMKLVSKGDFKISKKLDPDNYFSDCQFIKKVDVVAYEKKIKETLHTWASLPNAFAPTSPFQALIRHFCNEPQRLINNQLKLHKDISSIEYIAKSTLPMLKDLHSRDLLPTICFNYDRQECEFIAETVYKTLTEKEREWRENSEEWKEKMREYKKWQASATQRAKQAEKFQKLATEKQKLQALKEAGDVSWIEFFDPNEPSAEFSFAGVKSTYGKEELYRDLESLRNRHAVPEWYIDALYRGIAIHHSGLNRRYRQIVEVLFRCGQLTVVIATRTLSLGINMPCKTVVFLGDSQQLTALNFHQAAGRAGRRGFDLLGRVGFLGVPMHKIYRLLTTKLWDIQGQYPVTTTLTLQLSQLVSGSQASPFARDLVKALVNEPKFMKNGETFSVQFLHHLRFNIEYLRREGLLDEFCKPINLSTLTTHLYYAEPSNYAFINLLRQGIFHDCAKVYESNRLEAMKLTVSILAHLFGRIPLSAEYAAEIKSRNDLAPSEVLLPELPSKALDVLRAHDQRVLDLYKTYIRLYQEHGNVGVNDTELPLSKIAVGGTEELPNSAKFGVISPFHALGGYTDADVKDVPSFLESISDNILLKTSHLPFALSGDKYLNAYLLDFFVHGSVELLVEQNDLKHSEIWFVLNDFSLALATICSCLGNLLNLVTEADLENAMSALEGSDALQASSEKTDNNTTTTWTSTISTNYSTTQSPDEKLDVELFKVYRMFLDVRNEFDTKFKKMWA
ncbi:DEAD/DEAH box helicase [Schizosaccharomyces japonicus yFS275]|uniref:DEAD/DEAH box helicase n=1 Tax=Schizosaccharomyces japonicus (strain yFS275 / FY16936) TaxID=402676 RepID=B6JY40_SCHJY|nr:DEAD/DEAH box helicase [Schizosaccharomyces japonicus yFS275]EEB06458.1 DEAD/DEAH box helicase [Schizosaccharomyces japonicus yFS275]